jgi:hypothetical protein
VSAVTAPEERAEGLPAADDDRPAKPPLYWRLLRLRHVHPNGWQRALLVEGSFGVAALLTLADFATAWTLVVLPLAVAAVVKLNDVVAGWLAPATADDDGVRRRDDQAPPAGG